jgi:hypothetical protein
MSIPFKNTIYFSVMHLDCGRADLIQLNAGVACYNNYTIICVKSFFVWVIPVKYLSAIVNPLNFRA